GVAKHLAHHLWVDARREQQHGGAAYAWLLSARSECRGAFVQSCTNGEGEDIMLPTTLNQPVTSPELLREIIGEPDPPALEPGLSDHLPAIPERPGNRRTDTMRSILANPHLGLIFLIPGWARRSESTAGPASFTIQTACRR